MKMSNKKRDNHFTEILETILREMCGRVNTDYDKMDFTKNDWFRQHSWTVEEEKDFIKWMTTYLYNNTKARNELMNITKKNKKNCEEAVRWWIFTYGWTYKASDLES